VRAGRSLVTTIVLAGLIAGCAHPKRQAATRLAERVDQARRLYEKAANLLADPQYVLNLQSGGLLAAGAATRPAGQGPRAEKELVNPLAMLERAEGIVERALAENAQATVTAKADANVLLGQVRLAIAEYRVSAAGRVRSRTATDVRKLHGLLDLVRSEAMMAKFYESSTKLPRGSLVQLRKEAAEEAKALADKATSLDGDIKKLEGEIRQLRKVNEKRFAEAARLRDRGDIIGGEEGLALLTQAAEIDLEIHQRAGEIASKQERVELLKVDKSLLQKEQSSVASKQTAFKTLLEQMDKKVQAAAESSKKATFNAERWQGEAEAVAAELVGAFQSAATYEQQALDALEDAGKSLGAAVRQVRQEWQAARAESRERKARGESDEIVSGMANDQHLASTMALKASVNLSMGDLRRNQLGTAKINNGLAASLGQTAALLGRQPPAVAGELRDYVTDEGETTKLAEANYELAERDLEEVLGSYLKSDEIGRNIQWIYQAKLAGAYLGHYLLVGDAAVLDKARDLVDKALADKEASPHLAPVLELRRLVAAAATP